MHIQRSRVFSATIRTFESLLKSEPRHPEIECPVYGHPTEDDNGFCYFFSPQAAIQYNVFLKFWGGLPCAEPPQLTGMKRII